MSRDFYELLGVSRGATADEIKKAYRRRARDLHPDANPDDPEAEERFKEVSRAYEVLSNPETRERYDRFGEAGLSGAAGGGDPFSGGGLGDIFEAFFGGSGGFGAQRGPSGPPRGHDLEATVTIPLSAVVSGERISVEVATAVRCGDCGGTGAGAGTKPVTCTECNGQGQVRTMSRSMFGQMVRVVPCTRCSGMGEVIVTPCVTCRGEGRTATRETYTADVPPGIHAGQTLRLSGRGMAGPRGGPAGDLFVHVLVDPHPVFRREDDDLVADLEISIAQAALGMHTTLEAFDGEVDLVVPPGTQPGHLFIARGRGVPRLGGRGRGNLVVRIVVVVPRDLSDEEEAHLRRFAEARGDEVAPADRGFFSRIKSAFT